MSKNDYGMTLLRYQEQTNDTAVYPDEVPPEMGRLLYAALGLAGEAGEVCDQIKKSIRNENGKIYGERLIKIVDEIGDCLWYIARVAEELSSYTKQNFDLNIIAARNLDKLRKRKLNNELKERK